jgi:hypothetical protein
MVTVRRVGRAVASPVVADVAGVPVAAVEDDALVWGVADEQQVGQVASSAVADVAGVPVAAVDRDAGVWGGRCYRRGVLVAG